jgi:electron transport complex protein RnfD
MLNVVYAMIPICLFAVYQFGLSAFALILVCTCVCVLTEYAFNRFAAKENTLSDYSAVISGVLLALTLPPGFPLWMAAVGAFVAIALGKLLFGGIGFNVFNPALVGRAFLQAAFPVAITTWTPSFFSGRFMEFIPSTLAAPFMSPPPVAEWVKNLAVEGWSGATPLSLQKFGDGEAEHVSTGVVRLFTGMSAGSAGETSALIILLCGAYLVARNMMDWRIPAAMLLGAFVTGALFWFSDATQYPNPFFILFSGGLILGAVFMATDMVSSPVTPLGVWIYGLLMGFLTVIIRLMGGLPEGVMYAILMGNALAPIIDNLTQPRVYGTKRIKAKS